LLPSSICTSEANDVATAKRKLESLMAIMGGSDERDMSAHVDVRPPEEPDFPAVAALLAAEGFGHDALQRLSGAHATLRAFSLVAILDTQIQGGVLLASFNGWHVFASHLAVAPGVRRRGLGRLLVETLARNAQSAGAKGIITDAWLSGVAFFSELEFRLPGAVFLIRDLP
jgi:predicted N-acetyltransferase YhbS